MDFAPYQFIALGMVAVEAALIFLTYRRNPRVAIYMTIISLVMKGQYLWLGRPLYAWHLSAFLGLIFIALPPRSGGDIVAGGTLSLFRKVMIAFFLYSFLISMLMWVLLPAAGIDDASHNVTLERMATQTFYLLLLVGIFWFGVTVGRFMSIRDFLRAIVILAAITAYFAIIQVLVFSLFGVNLFPIIGSDNILRSAFILDTTFRATSFAGEPKHLGMLMSIGLSAFFLTRIFRISVGRYSLHIPISMITALLLSLSTTGLYLSIVSVGTLALIFLSRLRKIDLALFAVVVVLGLTDLVGFSGSFESSLAQQLSKFNFEVQDESVMLALLENPAFAFLGTGLGNIHLFAVEYLPANFPLFRTGGYKANSGFLFILGDSGIVGLALLLLAPACALSAYLKERGAYDRDARREGMITLALLGVALLSFMLRYSELYFFIAGFAYTRLAIARNHARALAVENSASRHFRRAEQKRTHKPSPRGAS